mmetsp:Transcript_12807/g.33885  ORF Transcript_12807/g.33885 Transcript_12807/m.33885 type:complete len:90 (+) Transcript_12807:690-959(+)
MRFEERRSAVLLKAAMEMGMLTVRQAVLLGKEKQGGLARVVNGEEEEDKHQVRVVAKTTGRVSAPTRLDVSEAPGCHLFYFIFCRLYSA